MTNLTKNFDQKEMVVQGVLCYHHPLRTVGHFPSSFFFNFYIFNILMYFTVTQLISSWKPKWTQNLDKDQPEHNCRKKKACTNLNKICR